MRIAVAGIGHETNTFSSLRTELSDFWVRRGDDCVANDLREAFPQVEFVPCLTAGATPNGLVSLDAYSALNRELLDRLRSQLPVDGLYLALHGAMEVENLGDGETDLLASIRSVVGPDLPIAASLDLHGNLSPDFVASVNILSALRTAPHIDGSETRIRTFGHLVRAIQEQKVLSTAMVKLPLLLPGEYAVTAIEPSKSLYSHIAEIEEHREIWDASLMISCAWTDSPFTSVSTLVVGESAELAASLAHSFADLVWSKRRNFGPEVETLSVDEAIAAALRCSDRPIFISDSGDNVTAGGAGDVTCMLSRLIQEGVQDVLVAGITDPEAVQLCASAKVGDTVSVSLGGKLDKVNAEPLDIEAKVLRVEHGMAAVEVGGITILVIDGRRPFHTLASFTPSGIDPLTKKIVVVKQGYLAPELRERCNATFMALSPGFTDLKIETLPYQRVKRPIYPLDPL